MQYPLIDVYKYNGRECKIFALRPYTNCGCKECCNCRNKGFSASICFLNNNEVLYWIDSDYLQHLEGDSRNWPSIVCSQGWDSVDEYYGILRHTLPKTVVQKDYINRVLPKNVYLQRLTESNIKE